VYKGTQDGIIIYIAST